MTSVHTYNPTKNSDGTLINTSKRDAETEQLVSKKIQKEWGCTANHYAPLSVIDFYLVQHNRVMGNAEIKGNRNHKSTDYTTVFLAFHKWIALLMAQQGTGLPSIAIFPFSDCVRFIHIMDVDATKIVLGGMKKIEYAQSNIEPCILVPISSTKLILPNNSPFYNPLEKPRTFSDAEFIV